MKISDAMPLAATVAVLFLVLFVWACRADPSADYVEGERSAPLVAPEIETTVGSMLGRQSAAAMMHALRLQMSKYDLDMTSQSGRRAWHGRLIREEVYTNEQCKVEVYSNEVDGAVWRYRLPFRPAPKVSGRRTVVTMGTNGVPVRLAAARAARNAQRLGEPVVTNVVTIANGGR